MAATSSRSCATCIPAAKRHGEAAGVDQFNVYLMNGDEEAQLEQYGRDVIPGLREATEIS